MSQLLEEGNVLSLDFAKTSRIAEVCRECIPVVIQHADTGAVLLVAYTNAMAMEKAFKERRLILWSTSRNALWDKGAQSGNAFDLVSAYVNCEQNALLYLVRPRGEGVCHTMTADGKARESCFYRRIDFDNMVLDKATPSTYPPSH